MLTVAIADTILSGISYVDSVRRIGSKYTDAGNGGAFMRWVAKPESGPYNSWGNGAACGVSPVGFVFTKADEVLAQAKATARITHNPHKGVKGAQAAALAVFLGETGGDREIIRSEIAGRFGYDLDRTVE